MAEKLASVARREDRLYVFSASDQTTAGIWVLSCHVATQPITASDEVLGQTLLKVLAQSRSNVPHPDWRTDPGNARILFKAAGVRSWAAYAWGTEICQVSLSGKNLLFTPQRSESGPGAPAFPIVERKFRMSARSSKKRIGAAVRKGLDRAMGLAEDDDEW